MADEADTVADSPAVLIRVIRSGGVVGAPRAWRVETSDADARAGWAGLVDACPWDGADPGRAPGADRFAWRIVVRAPEPPREVRLPETAVRGPWRELVDRVRAEGARETGPRRG